MSSRTWRIEDALNRAIQMEEQAHSLYLSSLKITSSPESKRLLEELAEEEKKHKEKLQNVKNRGEISELGSLKKVADLGILSHVEETPLSKDSSYQEILIFAGKREKESFDYYAEMASRLRGTDVGTLLERLAQEELGHKAKIEREYERVILKEA